MACAMLVILYVNREISYEKGFDDHDKIYRVSTKFFGIGDFAGSSPILVSHLREQSWVQSATRIATMGSSMIRHDQTKVNVSRMSMADSTFFKIFSYPFIEGSVDKALTSPGTVVISKEIAEKLFGKNSALEKTVSFDGRDEQFEIVGVFDKSDILTHLESEVYMSDNEPGTKDSPWWSVGPLTYIKLQEPVAKSEVEKHLKELTRSVVYPASGGKAEATEAEFEEWFASENGYRFYAFPLEDIYFDAKLKFEPFVGGDFKNIIIFSVIGLLIVAIASFNFINLSTAKAIRRATEVGIRKTLGSGKLQLMGQFMLESMLISLLATFIALGLTELFIMLGNHFIGAGIPFGVFSDKGGVILLLLFALVVGALSSAYPAFYLTRFSPSRVMKGSHTTGKPGFLRNVLVIVQFTISIALIIGSLVIYKQIDFIRNKDLGFDQSNSIIIKNLSRISSQQELRNEMEAISGVAAASITDRTPGDQNDNVYSTTENGKQMNFEGISADADIIPILNLMVIEGRNFDRQRLADTATVIFNQKAVELLGWTDPIGKIFDERYTIIGIVNDFHFESMKTEIEPLIIFNKGKRQNSMVVKVDERTSLAHLLRNMETLWQKHNSEINFEYSFLDQNYAKIVEKDERQAKAISMLTGVAVMISLLGLLGLCSYTMERKTKEIGIRKVLGASWQNIISLFSLHFVKFVLLAFLISVPLAWYFTDMWLKDFAYHTEPGPWLFIAGGLLVILPTWIIISVQSISAAKTNPVDSLRDE